MKVNKHRIKRSTKDNYKPLKIMDCLAPKHFPYWLPVPPRATKDEFYSFYIPEKS